MDNIKIESIKNFFKGWYFKQSNGKTTVAFIPAYHTDSKGVLTVSIQFITDNISENFDFKAEDIQIKKPLQINIKNNIFAENGIVVNLKNDTLDIKALLKFTKLTPLKKDIMGYYKYIPFMQCKHKIISMYHEVSGYVFINDEKHIFDKGCGYIESDYGNSFPKEYLWTECNWKDENEYNNVIMLSIAEIPFLFKKFTGCICAIIYKDKEYRLATYNGAKIEKFQKNKAVIKQGCYKLTVELIEDKFQHLKAPKNGEMNRRINECISTNVKYIFTLNENVLFSYTGKAGFEYSKFQL
jgi:hypothetical protein